jgi:hypothetical protein
MFILTEEQSKEAWSHPCPPKEKDQFAGGAIGGRLTFSFTPNGLGTVINADCNLCGWSKDFTDYENW